MTPLTPRAARLLKEIVSLSRQQAGTFRFAGYFPPHTKENGAALGGLVRRSLIFKSMRGGYKPTTLGEEFRKCS